MPATLSRATYAAMFGPTTGGWVCLGDTNLSLRMNMAGNSRPKSEVLQHQ